MDKTSIVPNQFFDLFARVIPGGVLIIALALIYPIRIIDWTFEVFVPEGYPQTQSGTLRTQTVPWLVLVLAVAYTLGHLLSPVVKLLMWVAARIDARWPGIEREETLDALCENETHTYNELRFNHPDRIIYATRIRAEYTMYGGIAAAMIVAAVCYGATLIAGEPLTSPRWIIVGVLVFCGGLYRYVDVHKRFCKTINAFARQANERAAFE